MASPQVFISAVSSEFKTLRRTVAEIVTRLGYTPVTQEIFGTEAGDLREVLRNKIDGCAGLIQIVGHAYGAEPPTVEADRGRVSYTQYELLYARQKGKKTWIILAGEECHRDHTLHELDMPADGACPDPAAYQQERRDLATAYRNRLQEAGDLFHLAATDKDVMLRIEQLRDDLGDLRKHEARWRKALVSALAVILSLLLLVGGGVWWMHRNQTQLAVSIEQLKTNQTITRDKIRAQLLESAENAHRAALVEVEKAPVRGRQRLREAAEKEQAARLSRIDSLASEFAEIEGTERATAVYDEMARILANEGVDSALSYAKAQQKGILDRVRARAAAARKKNCDELRPLLKSAQLFRNKGELAQADAMLSDILAVEPDWPDALHEQAWCLFEQVDRATLYATLTDARRFLDRALPLLERYVRIDPSSAQAQRDLSASYNRLGDVQVTQGELKSALESYGKLLEISRKLAVADPSSAQAQRDLSIGYNRLGDVQVAQGDLKSALENYGKYLEISRKLAAADPSSAQAQRDLSVSYNRLGDVQVTQGDLKSALESYGKGLEISRKLAAADPSSAQAQRDLSVSYNRLGDVQVAQGDLKSALESYGKGLEISRKLAAADPSSAQAQRDLSVSYEKLGNVQVTQGELKSALESYGMSLEIRRKLAAADPSSAQAQRDLFVSYNKLGDVQVAQGDLKAALESYGKGLEISRKLAAADPSSAQAQRDLYVSCWKIADVSEKLQDPQATDWWMQARDVLVKMKTNGMHLSRQDEGTLDQLCGKLCWPLALDGRFAEAVTAGERAVTLLKEDGPCPARMNMAHAYLFTNQFDKAKAIYAKYLGQSFTDGRKWNDELRNDFKALREKGHDHPDIKKIEALLGPSEPLP